MFANRICEPESSSVSNVCALTVAWVPTGMNSGVFTSLCSVRNVPARARDPVAVASSLKFSRLVDIAAHLGGKGQKCKGAKRGRI